jgi:hypothetical protein
MVNSQHNPVCAPLPGICCPTCRRSEMDLRRDAEVPAVLACANCGLVARLLQRRGDPAPAFDLDDTTSDVPRPGSWWIGMVKGADDVVRPVALAPTLNSAWDAVLSCPLRGAVFMMPTDPPAGVNQGDTDAAATRRATR